MGNQTSKNRFEYIKKSSQTTTSSPPSSPSGIQIERLETFLLVWLDEKKIDERNESLKRRLREYLTCFVCFDDVRSCEQWFKSRSNDEKFFLISSERFGKRIVSNIHQFPSIIAIYIFCWESEDHLEWTNNFNKIRAVTSKENELEQRIFEDRFYFENIEDSKKIEIFQACPKTQILNPEYLSIIWYQLFVHILFSSSYLPRSPSYREVIDLLRQSISNDQLSSDLIKEFEETYSKENAMKWLINNTPISRFLHKALREENIPLLFSLRFFLIDIHNYLISNQISSSIHLYRKQVMSHEVIQKIHSNLNNYLMFNHFLLTTTNPSDSSSINSNDEQYQTVFIEIDAEYCDGTVPFAYVQQTNDDPSVLFMCGAILKMISLKRNIDSTWILRLSLVGNKELDLLNENISKLRKTNDLLIIVELLNQINQSKRTNCFSQELIRQFPPHHPFIAKMNQKMNINCKVQFLPLTRSKFVFIDLKDQLSPLALAMFDALQSLTNHSILVLNNLSEFNSNHLFNKTMKIFTNSEMYSSIKKVNLQGTLYFLLGEDQSSNKQVKYLQRSEDLIFELADQLSQSYQWEIEHDQKSSLQKEQIEKEIHQKLKEVYRTFNQTSICTDTTIIWLKYDQQNDQIIEKSKHLLENIVESFVVTDDPNDCYAYATTEGFNHSLFIIIDNNYNEKSIATLPTLSNLKRIYRYNQPTIRYRLICDLISHYNQLGARLQEQNITDNAKDMFLKARNLCQILPKL